MAVNSVKLKSTLVIQYVDGVDKEGKDIIKSQRFNNVKVSATDENIYDVGNILGSLLIVPIVGVLKEDKAKIISQ